MSNPFLRFEDGKVTIGSKDLLVRSANLSLSTSLQPERVYGKFNKDIVGAKTKFVKFAPIAGIKGQLEINFLINADTFSEENTNNISRLFKIAEGMSERPIHTNVVGRYAFDNMYLSSFSFSMSPFKLINATAKYDIYGSITKTVDKRFAYTEKNFAHGLKSFGEMKASDVSADSMVDRFEITNLTYSIIVGRKIHSHIRDNEHTSINTNARGALPYRVSVEAIETEMSIEANEMIPLLNSYGDYQYSSSPKGLEDSAINAYLYSLEGDQIARFSCEGKIQSQSMSVSEGSHAKSNIVIKGVVK